MLLPVVVGVDGSAESLVAAEWAAREAVRRERPLRLVLVRGRRPDGRPSAVRRALHEAEERAARAAPGVVLGSEVVDGPVADRLVRAAGRGELLVLGCRGPHGFTGFPVGPVVLGAVAGAVRPVVLVRAGEPSDDDRRTPPGRRRPGEGGGRRHRAALGASGSVEQASDDDHRTPHGASGKAGEEDDDHRAVPGTSGTAGQESDSDHRAAPGVSGPAEPESVGGASDTRDVVLGLDLGDPRDDVIAFAFEEARVRGARLKVVHAWDPPSLLRSRPGETYVADGPRQAEEWLGLMTAVLQSGQDARDVLGDVVRRLPGDLGGAP
ncbi:universal stress protein, partial [Streptomyces sp. NPDC003832]